MNAPVLHPAIPILRIYDKDKALEFYRDFLGCTVDWEHRFAADLPLYMQVSRGGMVLHLSEHYGDGTPGTAVWIKAENSRALFEELRAKQARFARPGVDSDEATLTDPFGNMLRFDGSRN
jgi:catechol 2,3-dioxygenase-like lactoylglutathione lyase family enzyme